MKRPRIDTEANHRLITRRAALLGGAQLLFVGALGARMQFLQVDQADQFRMLAEENRINIRIIPPARGEVFDRNGIALARNVPSYRIVMVREDAGDIDEVMERLAAVVALDPTEVERARGVTHNRDLPWERRDHALFVNFAPYDNPKYAVSVVVEHGGGGSTAAAPIARDITLQALYGGEPPIEAYPTKDRAHITEQQRALRAVRPVANVTGKDQA